MIYLVRNYWPLRFLLAVAEDSASVIGWGPKSSSESSASVASVTDFVAVVTFNLAPIEWKDQVETNHQQQ